MQAAEVLIIGGGLAGLSAAIYLGRAKRTALVIDAGESMARWEPVVSNYLGFPKGINGSDLLNRGRSQARRAGSHFVRDRITSARLNRSMFTFRGEKDCYRARHAILATGTFHIPPDLPGVTHCLGKSMFFCKDCDGCRVQGKAVAVYGWTNEAVDYALGLLLYSPCVALVTDGRDPRWGRTQAHRLREYCISVHTRTILNVRHTHGRLRALRFNDGSELNVDALFTTRGDIYFNELARELGACLDPTGQVVVDGDMRTTVPGLYAAGCVTPANCQMIIAAGQGATAAQAVNRDLFEQGLANHALRRFRRRQLRRGLPRAPAVEKPSSKSEGHPEPATALC